MVSSIDITDLACPCLTKAQLHMLALGEVIIADFSESGVLWPAQDKTGLIDFGPEDFRPRMRILREEWDRDSEITALHRAVLHGYLVRYAANRLLIRDTLKRHPEILEEEIHRPIIVAGLPRSGTTHLVNLLAADRRFHSLPLWEAYEPLPFPGEVVEGNAPDPRYTRCADAWETLRAGAPLIAAMHPMEPDHIHEDLELMGPDFASCGFEWLTLNP